MCKFLIFRDFNFYIYTFSFQIWYKLYILSNRSKINRGNYYCNHLFSIKYRLLTIDFKTIQLLNI